MAVSMTGFGEATLETASLSVRVEIRSLNNRFLKVHVSLPEGYTAYIPQVEQLIRQRLRRGTVYVYVYLKRVSEPPRYRIHEGVLEAYKYQLESLRARFGFSEPVRLDMLLSLPGVIEPVDPAEAEGLLEWPILEGVISSALEQLDRSRRQEGAAMAASLRELCRQGLEVLSRIEAQAPQTVTSYRQRFEERFRSLLATANLQPAEVDILREVAAFADRVDIGEEIVRLRGHFTRFLTILDSPDTSGRQLDFLAQEMHREATTIGAKAADEVIAHCVVEMKTIIERIRELVQNLE